MLGVVLWILFNADITTTPDYACLSLCQVQSLILCYKNENDRIKSFYLIFMIYNL